MGFFRNLKQACRVFFKALKDPKVVGQLDWKTAQSAETSSETASHLRLLNLLQIQGRLIDFLKEDLSSFNDSQIGSAVRKIHADCSQTLEEFVTIRPLLNEEEGSTFTVPFGYNPQAIKVIGKVIGEPPYQGIVRHKGWKAHKVSLPKLVAPSDPSMVYPAEVEVT